MEGSHFQLVPANSLPCFIYNLCFHCLICVRGLDSKLFRLQWAGGKFVTRRHWRDVEEGGSSFPDSDISVQFSLFAIATLWHDTDIKNGAKPPITLWWQADKWKTIMKLGYYLAITKNEVLIGCNIDDPWKYCERNLSSKFTVIRSCVCELSRTGQPVDIDTDGVLMVIGCAGV